MLLHYKFHFLFLNSTSLVKYNHHKKTFKRGEEKGYFLPGASTVIVVANNINVDKDILLYSKKGIETAVSVGEKVGE